MALPLLGWFRRFANKSMTYAQWFAQARDVSDDGSNDSGVDTSRPFAQSVWVHAAVNLVARTLANVPFVVEDEHERPIKPRKSGNDLAGLLDRPNRRQQDWQQFVIASMTRLLLDGHLCWQRAKMQGNRPREVVIHGIDKLYPEIGRDEYGNDYAVRWCLHNTEEPLIPDDELFEWKLFNPYNDVYGLAPLSPGALALYCDVATGYYNKVFFENGARPGITFTSDHPQFDQAAADAALAMWNSKYKGARRGHQAAFLGHGLKPTVIGYTYSDMEFPALKAMSKAEILAIFGVPDSMLGSKQPATGVEIGSKGRNPDEEKFILSTVMLWADQFAKFFDRVVAAPFGRYQSYFDFRKVPILQDRLLERAKEGREWVKAGATFNDVNHKFALDFEDTPTGNDWWVPSNMLPARLLMNGPIAAAPDKDHRDSADSKDAKKSVKLVEAA